MTDTSPPDNSRQLCPDCNTPFAPGKKFCESCGAKIDTSLRCSQCGAPVSKGIKFCESCGAPLDGTPAVKPPVVPLVTPGQILTPEKIEEPAKPQQPSPSSKLPDPKNPLPIMKVAIVGIVILFVLALGAYIVVLPMFARTDTSQKSGGITPGSVIPTTSSPADTPRVSSTSGSSSLVRRTLTPGPTQLPPPNLEVNFQAERDPISGIVTVTFTGGAGQNGVREVVSRLTRSDGQVITKTFTLPRIGTSETLEGTKMTDRVEIIVYYYNGNRYTVLDQIFEYKKR